MKKFLIIAFLFIAIHTNTLYAQDFLTSQLMQYFMYASTLNEDNLPHNNESFSKAKKLMKKVYYDNQYSFYCGCKYDYKQIKGKTNVLFWFCQLTFYLKIACSIFSWLTCDYSIMIIASISI